MYNLNDIVMHLNMGICEITEISTQKISGISNKFYKLKPLYENLNTVIYVPVNNCNKFIRYPLSKEQINNILSGVKTNNENWIENNFTRKSAFFEIIKSGDTLQIINMICELYSQKSKAEKKGKRLHIIDERFLKEAQKLINQEFAYALEVDIEEIGNMLADIIN